MLRNNRRELNDRFREVFEILKSRGEIVLNDRNGRGVGDFAEKILGRRAYGHIIRAYLDTSNRRCINFHEAEKLCEVYNVNKEYLFEGLGEPFGYSIEKYAEEAKDIKNGNILYTTVEALAGSGQAANSSTHEENSLFAIPGYTGTGYVAFPINGDSMEPLIQDGDIVICREVIGVHEVKNNEIYAVKSNGDIWIKYIQKMPSSGGTVRKMKLISANYLEYDPFEIEIDGYTKIYKVISRINRIS